MSQPAQRLCTLCGGSGWRYRITWAPKHRPCPRCHTTGTHPAPHALVLAVRAERAALGAGKP